MKLTLPELSLVVLIGASGSGKSTFAKRHFRATEILSSDYFRGLVSDDENDQLATGPAFESLQFILGQRLKLGKLSVIDATNVQASSRKSLVNIAREYHCIPCAIVLNLPDKVCAQRNKLRADRSFGEHVIRAHNRDLRKSLRNLKYEGFRHVYVLDSLEQIEAVTIERQPLWNNRKSEHGPFDIIGDVHGCFDELRELLTTLGYSVEDKGGYPFGRGYRVTPPAGRTLVFVGDLVDRGPRVVDVLRLAMSTSFDGVGLCVPGNHDVKLVRKLFGKDVRLTHGLGATVEQLEPETQEFKDAVRDYLDKLVSHYVFDDGKLVVAHAGMKEEYQGRGSGKVREFALYGETTGETDEFGLPIRYNWALEYRGQALVVYGHTPVVDPEWLNRTINVDTGCVFGGKLTALRYPERELVSVAAHKVHSEPIRPIGSGYGSATRTLQQENDDALYLEDVLGKRYISTRFKNTVTIQEENATAALEVMSRFAIDPRWLIYLPPTMSPSETSTLPSYLEHPKEAFAYYAAHGVDTVVCEEKHMVSRAVIVLAKDSDAARSRFGVTDGSVGACFSRTGRALLNDQSVQAALFERLIAALTASRFWETLNTDWVCLDCELMPWSYKAQSLLKQQYAAVGAAGTSSLESTIAALNAALPEHPDLLPLRDATMSRLGKVKLFVDSYRRYCWPVESIDDIKLAPFHILSTEGAVHSDKDHAWHMETIAGICAQDTALLRATPYKRIVLADFDSCEEGIDWWTKLTASGGEGMVVKPLNFLHHDRRGMVQPAVKCRGSEYLRIIYGPEYDIPENLARLRKRGLSTKRSLAIREFCLGLEALHRFVEREPLRRVHECVFGVLALESEGVDPRL
ncbi:MAG: polynucleotide kinase-phosphatase [Deltaproteobacteria bacterium]|nr:polynucleotide kinase-phosphatase [Deltaproteobacteria bacterium]